MIVIVVFKFINMFWHVGLHLFPGRHNCSGPSNSLYVLESGLESGELRRKFIIGVH